MKKKTYTGEGEIVDESPFPMMVDPGFYREQEELRVYRNDSGFWLDIRPHESAPIQFRIGVDELFVDGKRVDSPHFLDTMRRFEPDADELDGHVEMEDAGKTAEVEIPFEEWAVLNCVTIEEITVDSSYLINIEEMHLERYYDENPIVSEPTVDPF